MREPSGRTVGSAATIPRCGRTPDAVTPPPEYAVAVKFIWPGSGGGGGALARPGEEVTVAPQPASSLRAPDMRSPSISFRQATRMDLLLPTAHCQIRAPAPCR